MGMWRGGKGGAVGRRTGEEGRSASGRRRWRAQGDDGGDAKGGMGGGRESVMG
jgi:hypothetical protein